MPKFSANLGFLWRDRPLLDAIEAAAKAGFRAVELHWPYAEDPEAIGACCRGLGLVLLALNTPLGDTDAGEFGLAALPGRAADFADSFAQAVDFARTSGAGALHVMAGVLPPEQQQLGRETLMENLRRAAASAPDLTLLLEPLNSFDKPNYLYATPESAVEIISAVAAPNLKLMFDAYHIGRMQGDVMASFARHLPLIGHVQIAAIPSRAEPDQGGFDYRPFFAALDRSSYDGWVGCEYAPAAGTDAGLGWLNRLGQSL